MGQFDALHLVHREDHHLAADRKSQCPECVNVIAARTGRTIAPG